MNKFFAVFLLSALAVSASAFTMHDFVEMLSGFTTGFDFAEVNPAFHNCSAIINATKTSSQDVMAKLDDMTPEAFEQAVSKFGYNAAHSVRVCQHAKNVLIAFLELVEKEIKVLSSADIIGHLMNNLPVVTMKWTTMMKSIKSQDYHNAGIMIADLFRLMATGEVRTTQLRRQLSELSKLVTPQMVVDYNATVLGFLGFIEEGNTTFVANDYLTFVNHTTDFIGQFASLEAALEKFDFQAIINAVTNISKNAKVVAADAALLKQQAAAFAARDLPLFSSEAQITKAVESLFLDLPKTLTNIQRISGAYKNRDYREIGHGSGAVYNQLRDGAQRE